jgi:hypothetical protein
MDELPIDRSVKKLRALTLSLIFSGALNIGLVATGIWSHFQENISHLSIRPLVREKPALETSMDRFFSHIDKLSFHELVSYLTNRDSLDEGYLKRDLALAILVAFHHFHLEKALSGMPLQRREISLGRELKIEVFPGLSDDHFEAIIRFAYEEKWPLTAEGLYKLLKKWPLKKELSLEQAFFVTPEFHALQVLFQKTDLSSLLDLVCEGSWELLDRFSREQAQLLDLSSERRRALLLSYLATQSKTAAYLLLGTDFSFVAKRLEDQGIIGLISLLDQKTPETEHLCVDLLRSPRSDVVWMSAAIALYAYAGEIAPSPLDLQVAIARFAPGASPQKPVVPVVISPEKPALAIVETPKFRKHIVQDGDSLWKIARQYNVKVDELVKLNELEKDRLYPGMTLRIP